MSDRVLCGFVEVLENLGPGTSFSITLWIPGGVLTGSLVSEAHYLSQLGAEFGEALSRLDEEGGARVKDLMEDWAQTRLADSREAAQEEQWNPDASLASEPEFIHVQNARLLTPDGLLPRVGFLWRGRIDRIAGFAMGEPRTTDS